MDGWMGSGQEQRQTNFASDGLGDMVQHGGNSGHNGNGEKVNIANKELVPIVMGCAVWARSTMETQA